MSSTVPISHQKLSQELVFLNAWRPLAKRSHITVLGVIDSPCSFHPWAEATCPREQRIPHWNPWEQCPHLCISLVKTVSTLPWFRAFTLPHPDWFLFCFWMQHKMWPYWLLGPARTRQVANAMAQVHTIPATGADVFVTKPCLSSSFTLAAGQNSAIFQGHCSLNSTVFQFSYKLLTPENCYLPTQQLQVCQPEHHHSLPGARWGLRSQLSSCQGKIGDTREALTPPHQESLQQHPAGWVPQASSHFEPVHSITPQAATAQPWAAALPTCHRDLLLDAIMKKNLPFHPREFPLSLGHRRDGAMEEECRSCMVRTGSEECILSLLQKY